MLDRQEYLCWEADFKHRICQLGRFDDLTNCFIIGVTDSKADLGLIGPSKELKLQFVIKASIDTENNVMIAYQFIA